MNADALGTHRISRFRLHHSCVIPLLLHEQKIDESLSFLAKRFGNSNLSPHYQLGEMSRMRSMPARNLVFVN